MNFTGYLVVGLVKWRKFQLAFFPPPITLSRVFRCPSNLFPTWLYAGGSRVWQLTFAAAACSAPAPSIDPDRIDAGSGDKAVSRHSREVVIKPGNHRHKAGWGSRLGSRID